MKRLFPLLLVATLTVSACVDRSLEPSPGGDSAPDGDLGVVRTDSGTLVSGSDFGAAAIDLASPPSVDLSTQSEVGISCGATSCNVGECCTPGAGGAKWTCDPMQCGAQTGLGYNCDGPEDCDNGRRCIGSNIPDPGYAPLLTRCRGMNNMGTIVCHVDADCRQNEQCVDAQTMIPGAPPLRTCR